MLNRIEQRKGALSVMIYPNVDYAIYPHEGLSTSKKYGRRPFMEDAIRAVEIMDFGSTQYILLVIVKR